MVENLKAHAGFFRLHMKGIFGAYVLWLKKNISELVTRVSTRNWTLGYAVLYGEFEKKKKKDKKNWPSCAGIRNPDFQLFSRPWFEFEGD